tara:strand:- start:125 stop:370 length:246 start_codon:yes stop_codon:yes gene_type:complete
MSKLAFSAAVMGFTINLVVPKIATHLLRPTADEVSPPDGAAKLSLKGQTVHMLVHHEQVPLSSSLIVAGIVYASVLLAGGK